MRNMEVPPGQSLHFASGDVDTCFFQYRTPPSLRFLFGMPAIKKKYLRPEWRDHAMFGTYGLSDDIHLRFTIVPMGWSWSVFLIQMGQAELLADAGGEAVDLLRVLGRDLASQLASRMCYVLVDVSTLLCPRALQALRTS